MFAFVLMPFDSAFDDIYQLGIKETAEKLDIRAERVDEQIFHKENILERIYNQIRAADIIIADLTGRNANVFYEVGYAHGKAKPCLLLTSDADDIPFDLKHHRHLIYGDSIQNLRTQLERELSKLKSEVENRASSLKLEVARIVAELDRATYLVRGKAELFIDLRNHSAAPSPEIEAIYLYAGKGWSFVQEGQGCASTKSDIDPYEERHFVRSPIRRLNAGGWAQIIVAGSKILEWKPKEEQKEKYPFKGRCLVRVETTEGTLDFPLYIDAEFEEFPF